MCCFHQIIENIEVYGPYEPVASKHHHAIEPVAISIYHTLKYIKKISPGAACGDDEKQYSLAVGRSWACGKLFSESSGYSIVASEYCSPARRYIPTKVRISCSIPIELWCVEFVSIFFVNEITWMLKPHPMAARGLLVQSLAEAVWSRRRLCWTAILQVFPSAARNPTSKSLPRYSTGCRTKEEWVKAFDKSPLTHHRTTGPWYRVLYLKAVLGTRCGAQYADWFFLKFTTNNSNVIHARAAWGSKRCLRSDYTPSGLSIGLCPFS